MATDAVTSERAMGAAGAESAAVQPYPPSWIDRLAAWLEALPGPTWAAYLAVMAVATMASILQPALDGEDDPVAWAGYAFWGIVVPLGLWLFAYLSDIAGAAFDDFRPALSVSDDDARAMRYALTVTPARPALAIMMASAVFTAMYYVLDPVGSNLVGLTVPALVARFASETFFGGVLLTLLYQASRQLRDVGRIHDDATRVDLFRPGPLYAFSRYTARAAIVIALIFIVPTLVATAQSPTTTGYLLVVAPWIIGAVVAAAAVFVLPLRGMQRRIMSEKRRLQTEVGMRIEDTLATMHERIDADDPAGARAQHEVLQALVMERDLVDKLPTLPWRPGTLGAVVSAIIAPLGLFVVTRLLERVI